MRTQEVREQREKWPIRRAFVLWQTFKFVFRCRFFPPESQEYGAHVPLSVLDADNTTLRSLVPLVKAGTGGEAVAPVPGVVSSETMVRESPGR